MSKQDIEKRLGFAAQGVKEVFVADRMTTAGALRRAMRAKGVISAGDLEWYGILASDPDSAPYLYKAGALERMEDDRHQPNIFFPAPKKKSSRPGAKAAFAASDIIVKKDGQYIYYYPEDDDRATFPDDNGKGAYTVKSNRTGKPVSAKTYRSIQEAAAASNEMNEKLPPLKKAKASRPGVKIKFSAQFEAGRVYEHSFIGDYDAIVQWKVLSRTESTLTIKKVGEGNRNSVTTPTRGEEKRVKINSDAQGEFVYPMGKFSMAPILRASKTTASRPGAKAKFATEVGRKGNKSAMISRDATGTWYAYVVQRIETGIGKEEDMLGTMRAYSTEARAKAAALRGLETSGLRGGFARPGAKAKMGSSQVNDSATTADLIREAQRLRDVIKTSNREFDKTHLRQIKQELDRRGVLMPYGASEVLASRSGMKAKA